MIRLIQLGSRSVHMYLSVSDCEDLRGILEQLHTERTEGQISLMVDSSLLRVRGGQVRIMTIGLGDQTLIEKIPDGALRFRIDSDDRQALLAALAGATSKGILFPAELLTFYYHSRAIWLFGEIEWEHHGQRPRALAGHRQRTRAEADRNGMNTSLLEFIKTGSLGPICLGVSVDSVIELLGPPDLRSPKRHPFEILRYGVVDLHFSSGGLALIAVMLDNPHVRQHERLVFSDSPASPIGVNQLMRVLDDANISHATKEKFGRGADEVCHVSLGERGVIAVIDNSRPYQLTVGPRREAGVDNPKVHVHSTAT